MHRLRRAVSMRNSPGSIAIRYPVDAAIGSSTARAPCVPASKSSTRASTLETLRPDRDAETLAFNDIGGVRIGVARAIAADRYADNRATGSFILIDEATNQTVAGGMDLGDSIVGKVYLVGAGPGAPDFLTVRAARFLEKADIVLHDALVHPDTLALAVRARKMDVGKRYGKVSTEQRFIIRALIEAARAHETVVRLKGGDPMIFGRAQEEIDALRDAGIEVEVVPGITAALAAAATLKISLTQRGVARTVTFLTPRVGREETESEWLRPRWKPTASCCTWRRARPNRLRHRSSPQASPRPRRWHSLKAPRSPKSGVISRIWAPSPRQSCRADRGRC